MTTAAVVLAAGAGTRFAGSQHKLLTPFRGRPLVAWAVDHAVAAGLAETIVVQGPVSLEAIVPPGVEVVANPRWAEGQATSLAVAIEAAAARGHDAVVVGLGDQPMVLPSAWAAVASAHPEPPIAVASYGGRRGNPVRLPDPVWALLRLVGDEGARELMRRRPELVREVACEGTAADVDTLEDLHKWS